MPALAAGDGQDPGDPAEVALSRAELGGALCAAGVFAAGTLLVTVRGTRQSVRG